MREGSENWPRANKSSCSFKIMYLKAMFNIPPVCCICCLWVSIVLEMIYLLEIFPNLLYIYIYIYILDLSISIWI